MPAARHELSESSPSLGERCPPLEPLEPHTVPRQAKPLGALLPTPMVPCGAPTRRLDTVLALQRIESVAVRARQACDGRPTYSVDIYHRDSSSSIPVHGFCTSQAIPTRAPTPSATLRISYEAFLRLSHCAYELTRLSHTTSSCAFCRPVIFFNTTSALKPRRSALWFKSDRHVGDALTRYLQEMLRLCCVMPARGAELCHGQERVAQQLQRFLQASEERERGSL